jgi:4-hydroxybenzoate polyprenyltransferase
MFKSSPFDYFFVLRPLILIPCWNFLLISAFLARGKAGFTLDIILGLIIYTCLMGGVYILNQLTDIETDRINKKLFLLSEGYISIKNAKIEMILLWIIALALAFRFSWVFLIFIIISLIMGISYSLPPIKLKGKPLVDTLSNSLGYGMVNFAIGWLIIEPFNPVMFIRFLPYFLSIAAVFINTTVVDKPGDEAAHEITTAVLLGEPVSLVLSTVLMASAIFTAYCLKDLVCLVPALVSFPLFVYAAVYTTVKNKISRRLIIASFRLPGLLFTIVTAYLYPVYVLVLMVVLIGMRVYYKKRFNIVYPTLSQG